MAILELCQRYGNSHLDGLSLDICVNHVLDIASEHTRGDVLLFTLMGLVCFIGFCDIVLFESKRDMFQ